MDISFTWYYNFIPLSNVVSVMILVEILDHDYNTFIFFFLRDQDNAIIRPLPKIKRMISDNACLPHIVQVIAQI